MPRGYKEYYDSAASTKVLEVSVLKVFYVYPEFLESEYPEPPLRIDALGYNGEINYHSDFLYADYEYTEYNDVGLPLAHRVNLVEEESQLDDEDRDNYEYIEETWVQLCETLGVDQDGDYNTYKEMIAPTNTPE
jgi:hypothetical protein